MDDINIDNTMTLDLQNNVIENNIQHSNIDKIINITTANYIVNTDYNDTQSETQNVSIISTNIETNQIEVNSPPITSKTSLSIDEDTSILITQDILLKGTYDLNNDHLIATNVTLPENMPGTLIDNHDGTWTFTPNHDWNGNLDLKYQVTDGVFVTDGNIIVTVNDVPEDTNTGIVTIPSHIIYKTVEETYLTTEIQQETYVVQEPRTETYLTTEIQQETYVIQEPRTETYTKMEEQTITVPDYETRTETYTKMETHTETYVVQEPRTETYTEMETRTETYITVEPHTITVPRDFSYSGEGRNANNIEVKSLADALNANNGTNHENGSLIFKNINKSTFELPGTSNDTFIVQENCHESKIDLGGGNNVLIFEQNPGKDVEVSGGVGNDILVLPGKMSDYDLNNIQFEHSAFHGTITGHNNMSLEIRDFDAIKFSDGFKGNEKLLLETRIDNIEVEHTRDIQVPVEHTREVTVDVEYTRDIQVPVEHTREIQVQVGEHTETIQVPVEHTRDVMVDVEYTRDISVNVEHTRDVMVDVEYTRDVSVNVEHTREVQVIDTDAMAGSGSYQNDAGVWVTDVNVGNFGYDSSSIITNGNTEVISAGTTNDILGSEHNDLFIFQNFDVDNSWTQHVDGGDGVDVIALNTEHAWVAFDTNGHEIINSTNTQHGSIDLNNTSGTIHTDNGNNIDFNNIEQIKW